ncbi:MAG: hypothetical protein ABJB86_24875, partial [Bacteroidota bacterium]
MRIVSSILTLIVALGCFVHAFSQDKIYMGIGTQSGKVTDINADVIRYINAKGTASQVPVKDVFLIFSSNGNYLVPYRMDFTNKASQFSIKKFMGSPAAGGATDKIYTTDGKIIAGTVLKESKKAFAINDNGNKYDLDIKRIGVVVYHDGRHNVVSPIITATDILWTMQDEAEKNENKRLADIAKAETARDMAAVQVKPVEKDTPVQSVAKDAPVKPTPKDTQQKAIVSAQKQDTPVKGTAAARTPAGQSVKFEDIASNVSKEAFEKKALDKTKKLNEYLKVLCDKSADYNERNKAVDLAVMLFINEDAIVQTSSLNSDQRTNHKIRAYLKAIKLYNYDKV